MEKVNKTVGVYAQVLTFLVIWMLLLWAFGKITPFDLAEAGKKVPQAVTIYVLICLIFTKWLWRLSFLKGWLIKIPDLQGTWEGELKSDWINPETGEGIPSIPVILVIRQTYHTIKITMMTAESSSYSTASEISCCFGEEEPYLTYNYTNRPKATIRERSQIHDGATILKIIGKGERRLEGEYWTSRKTRGDMNLIFKTKKLAERFSDTLSE